MTPAVSQHSRVDEPTSLTSRALRVLDALRAHARSGIVCETTGVLAAWLHASTDTVRRGIAELVSEGWLEETPMRAGKARAYRLVESPQVVVESPHAAALEGDAGKPLKGFSSASLPEAAAPSKPKRSRGGRGFKHTDVRNWVSTKMDPDDRRHLDEFEWSPELQRDYGLRAATLTMRFVGTDLAALQHVGQGVCADCAIGDAATLPTANLLRVGSFDVCVTHASLRLTAASRVAAMTTAVPA